MDQSVIYSKTAAGFAELKAAGKNLSRDWFAALVRVDGRSSLADLTRDLPVAAADQLAAVLRGLESQGFIRATNSGLQTRTTGPDMEIAAIEVTELEPQEGVRAWAEARRGARALQNDGYFKIDRGGAGGRGTRSAAGLSVLVVEDTVSLAQLLATYLQTRGFLVHCVEDGNDAVDSLNANPPPDLVLLDVNLPGINGFQVLAHIRAQPRLEQVPVIMVTAQVTDQDVMLGLKGGADGYIFKPFQWPALFGCIQSVLSLDA